MRTLPSLILPSLVLSGLLIAIPDTQAIASTITWQFAGTVSSGGTIAEIPNGTPVTVAWTFDPATPNTCGLPNTGGFYAGQTATVSIASTVGLLTYQASGGFLVSSNVLPLACSSNVGWSSSMELRLIGWTGPSLPDAFLDPVNLPFPPGLFWSDGSLNGAFPQTQPSSVTFEMQPFFATDGSGRNLFVSGGVTAVPEPSCVLLVAGGLAISFVRRRQLRSRSR